MLSTIQNGKQSKSLITNGPALEVKPTMNSKSTLSLHKLPLFIKDMTPVSTIRNMVCPMVS